MNYNIKYKFFLWAMNRELKPVIQAGQEQPPMDNRLPDMSGQRNRRTSA
ncbi:hypothetical protein NUBL22018_51220 [Klebsiella variicola]|nr:hypothetical protein NUBL22018_51220 [Klebsiella variicola]